MMARLGELPAANGRPSSEATRMPSRSSPATFCEQRAQAEPATRAKAAASRARNGSRWLIRPSFAKHDAVCVRRFASNVPVKTGDGASTAVSFW